MKYLCLFVISAVAIGLSLTSLTTKGLATQNSASSAGDLFRKHCATCHGKDGRGKTSKGKQTQARDLTDQAWHEDASDERLFNTIMNGKRKMPGFSKKLSSQEIESLVRYIRALI